MTVVGLLMLVAAFVGVNIDGVQAQQTLEDVAKAVMRPLRVQPSE